MFRWVFIRKLRLKMIQGLSFPDCQLYLSGKDCAATSDNYQKPKAEIDCYVVACDRVASYTKVF